MLARPGPQLGLHLPLDLVAPAVEPADVEGPDLAEAVGFDGGLLGASVCDGVAVVVVLLGQPVLDVVLVLLVRQGDDAGLIEAQDLPLEQGVYGVKGREELIHCIPEGLCLFFGGGLGLGWGLLLFRCAIVVVVVGGVRERWRDEVLLP